MNRLLPIIMITCIGLASCGRSLSPEETLAIQQIENSRDYIFKAESVSPLSGRNMPLSPGYDLQVTPKAVIAMLPYFGRGYAVPTDPAQGGIRFTSKRFQYSSEKNAKGELDVLIIPGDVNDVQQLRIHITSGVQATLSVTSRDRQAITFYGYVTQNKVATNQ
jgi:hypothetical protein